MGFITNLLVLPRLIYRQIIPFSLRQKVWGIYWKWCLVTKDYLPASPFFTDYERYWDDLKYKAGDNFDNQISYSELVTYCLNEIPIGSRVLDFGCGPGTLLRELQSQKQVIGVGVDLSQNGVNIARSHKVNAHQLNLTKPDDLELFGRFDFATCTEVLEHIPHSELVLVALSHVTDRILVSIPNTGYLYSRLRLLLGRFPRQWVVHPSEHLRFWTLIDFCQMVTHLGFDVDKVIGLDGGSLGRAYPSLFAPALFIVLTVSNHKV